MALTVETGAGLSNADSYASLATAAAYAAAKGWSDWTGTDAVKENALREATIYLDQSYRWLGSILVETQALAWPREGVTDREGREVTGLPQRVVDACCELARSRLAGALVSVRTEGEIQSITAGSVSVTYARGSRASEAERFPWADRLLAGLHAGRFGGGNIVLVKS